jgi:hypothetical protein
VEGFKDLASSKHQKNVCLNFNPLEPFGRKEPGILGKWCSCSPPAFSYCFNTTTFELFLHGACDLLTYSILASCDVFIYKRP